MSIILFIVAASLFQTILEITHPVLLALSASSRNIWSHIKVYFKGGLILGTTSIRLKSLKIGGKSLP
jgi:hypothetical protein